MKSNYIVSALMVLFILTACKDKDGSNGHVHKQTGDPGIDSSLLSLVKPVNEQVIANIGTIKAESGPRIFSEQVQGVITYDTRSQVSLSSRVSGRIERLLIKYNFQPVKAGQLIMEIYSPDLVAAQRELLFIYQADKDDPMLQRAKQRLSLLGMQPGQVEQVLRTGKPLYRVPVFSTASGYILEKTVAAVQTPSVVSTAPASSGDGMGSMGKSKTTAGGIQQQAFTSSNTPVLIREGQYVNAGESLFTIYKANELVAEFSFVPGLAAGIKSGQKLVFRSTAEPDKVYAGSIGLIVPTIVDGQSFTVARVYISASTGFSVGDLITANIPVVKNRGWWLPKQAVWQLGNRSIVFRKIGEVFRPMEVQTGYITEGTIQVLTDISDWEIAKTAYYLVDSESFIKTNQNGSSQQ
ncbi:MAG TPA: efflux RND transporter periplasmic adaptor subunit [Chitinophagaceae bacterium]